MSFLNENLVENEEEYKPYKYDVFPNFQTKTTTPAFIKPQQKFTLGEGLSQGQKVKAEEVFKKEPLHIRQQSLKAELGEGVSREGPPTKKEMEKVGIPLVCKPELFDRSLVQDKIIHDIISRTSGFREKENWLKLLGQGIARNIGSAGITLAKPLGKTLYGQEVDEVVVPESLQGIFRDEPIKSMEMRIAEGELKVKNWGEKNKSSSDSGIALFAKTANKYPLALAMCGVFGSVGLDVTPFGWGGKAGVHIFKAMKGINNVGDAVIFLTKMRLTDDLAKEFAESVVKVKTDDGAKKLLIHIAETQRTTKPVSGGVNILRKEAEEVASAPWHKKISDTMKRSQLSNPISLSGDSEKVFNKLSKNEMKSAVHRLQGQRMGTIRKAAQEMREITNMFLRELNVSELKAAVFLMEKETGKGLEKLVSGEVLSIIKNPSAKLMKLVGVSRKYYDDARIFLNSNDVPVEVREHYLNHLWDIPRGSYMGKERKIPTYAAGLRKGYKPKYDNIVDLMSAYDSRKIGIVASKRYIKELPTLVSETGVKMIQNINARGVANWETVTNPLFKDIFGSEIVAVHPDIFKYIDASFSSSNVTGKFWKAYDGVNAVQKKSMFLGSLFHHEALTESIGVTINILRRKDLAEFRKVLGDMFKNIYTTIVHGQKNVKFSVEQKAMEVKWAGFGTGVSSTVDVAQGAVDKMFINWIRAAENVKYGGRAISKAHGGTVRFIKEGIDRADFCLWQCIHTPFKLLAAEIHEEWAIRQLFKTGENIPMFKIRNEIAGQVNDTFGGQVWEAMGVNKQAMRGWGRLMLSPDWGVSTFRQAMSPMGLFARDETMRKLKAQMGQRFWVKAGLYYGVIVNGLNWVNSKRIDGKGRFIWDNEEGNKLNLFTGYDDKGRRKYIRMGKQFREMLELVGDPVVTIGRKMSPLPQTIGEQITEHGVGGYPQSWHRDDGFEEVGGRMKNIGEKFLPLIIRADQTLGMWQNKAGMTNYRTKELFMKAIERNNQKEIDQIYRWALENNLNASGLQSQAKAELKRRGVMKKDKKYEKIKLELDKLSSIEDKKEYWLKLRDKGMTEQEEEEFGRYLMMIKEREWDKKMQREVENVKAFGVK